MLNAFRKRKLLILRRVLVRGNLCVQLLQFKIRFELLRLRLLLGGHVGLERLHIIV